MKTYVAEKTDDSVTLGLKDADVTLLQPIMDALYDNKDVLIVRYEEQHPELDDTMLYVQVKSGDALAAVKKAADDVAGYFSEIIS
ncbi:MAG: RpoL/Rpb11 RNA polymerase subunit family protein [Candidatus Methanomethylophilaceae archaeon]|jgi:DNA-directed RNA polymerase subunit L|nr:RpoL/Rpb11 RNA polymerase subunit family protein [Candidatus Methanomethylophilaceae archaeon]NCA73562.1 DNA-directed RNA polymerase subunit L [Gammaproteobacteria bacterium]MDD2936534.1 RpoL/Rpb11 RNA polymerase subunit family protein [Candidatus Methanomethylophilaceae archaeon]MDD3351494.1 RpoL/Rpb11 RNA polymerase subunit family protein [Candidatus Methanomethylophilaceae archaeon]MDD3986497.1 RpoL/Rpb11 RNA polymerase subunit family protein [Candidatus Methanomethylophilaceae archaeon]